ncbi:MAG TPA: hypothetical protein VFT99_16145, partial [Roseiflexaceae bacterium]|nr:hypothetical protein [Roseiflexaceae bacterium]
MLPTSHIEQARELATYELEGVQLRTGDIICTTDGHEGLFFGFAYLALGMLVPGPIDHNVMYVGPGPRFVEAGIRGPIVFTLHDGKWGGLRSAVHRLLLDRLYGVADPTAGRGLSEQQERRARLAAADYCLLQARIG